MEIFLRGSIAQLTSIRGSSRGIVSHVGQLASEGGVTRDHSDDKRFLETAMRNKPLVPSL